MNTQPARKLSMGERYADIVAELDHVTAQRDSAQLAFSKLAAAHDAVLAQRDELLKACKAARSILAPIVHGMSVRTHFSEKNTLANLIDPAIHNAEQH